MPDHPKCPKCVSIPGIHCAQTYKMAGRQVYICHDCNRSFKGEDFDPIEFEWRTNKADWETFVKARDKTDKVALGVK